MSTSAASCSGSMMLCIRQTDTKTSKHLSFIPGFLWPSFSSIPPINRLSAYGVPSPLRYVELRGPVHCVPGLVVVLRLGTHPFFRLCRIVCWAAPNGGEGGIRTPGRVSTTTDFESVTFGHSATSPYQKLRKKVRSDVFGKHGLKTLK